MKKFIKIVSMAILSMIATAALFACVPSNMEKAKEKMKREGYEISVFESSGILLPKEVVRV